MPLTLLNGKVLGLLAAEFIHALFRTRDKVAYE